MIDRRTLIARGVGGGAALLLAGCGAALLLAGCGAAQPGPSPTPAPETLEGAGLFDDLMRRFEGGLGVSALDTGSGRRIDFDASSRYAMCSTFKLPLAGMILAMADKGDLALDGSVSFGKADLVPYAPVVEQNLARGSMTYAQLCEAAVTMSDNAAANLLLRAVDGPVGFTAFLRSIGDPVTRLDRNEPDLNTNLPGDPRDTTTPGAMLDTLNTLLLGDVLSPAARAQLAAWAVACRTGDKRLRAGLPSGWKVGDKTGTSGNGAANDVAIAWPPDRAPVLIASFIKCDTVSAEQRDAGHAEVARRIAAQFA